jgi:hypothetical protein
MFQKYSSRKCAKNIDKNPRKFKRAAGLNKSLTFQIIAVWIAPWLEHQLAIQRLGLHVLSQADSLYLNLGFLHHKMKMRAV